MRPQAGFERRIPDATPRLRSPVQCNAKLPAYRSNRRQRRVPPSAGDGRMVTMKTPTKAKARTNVRAFLVNQIVRAVPAVQIGASIRPLRVAPPEAPGLQDL